MSKHTYWWLEGPDNEFTEEDEAYLLSGFRRAEEEKNKKAEGILKNDKEVYELNLYEMKNGQLSFLPPVEDEKEL